MKMNTHFHLTSRGMKVYLHATPKCFHTMVLNLSIGATFLLIYLLPREIYNYNAL